MHRSTVIVLLIWARGNNFSMAIPPQTMMLYCWVIKHSIVAAGLNLSLSFPRFCLTSIIRETEAILVVELWPVPFSYPKYSTSIPFTIFGDDSFDSITIFLKHDITANCFREIIKKIIADTGEPNTSCIFCLILTVVDSGATRACIWISGSKLNTSETLAR